MWDELAAVGAVRVLDDEAQRIAQTCGKEDYQFVLYAWPGPHFFVAAISPESSKLPGGCPSLAFASVEGNKVKSYLFTTAHHVIVDTVRKDKRSTRMEDHHENIRYSTPHQPDLKEVLDEALATLPEVQRSVVLLRDLEGYTYEEIAEITGLNLTQVKVYIYRGRTTLKDYIGNLELVL